MAIRKRTDTARNVADPTSRQNRALAIRTTTQLGKRTSSYLPAQDLILRSLILKIEIKIRIADAGGTPAHAMHQKRDTRINTACRIEKLNDLRQNKQCRGLKRAELLLPAPRPAGPSPRR